jgi:predicted permease
LAELVIIPFTFLIQIVVSALGAFILSKLFRLHKRGTFFVIAMAVFGNSNSLPISLIVSLSKTLPSLQWDKIPGDNPDEVAARGILYLLINQQLGQILRWTVGYKYLLAPPSQFKEEEGGTAIGEEESGNGHAEPEDQDQSLLGNSTTSSPENQPSSPVDNVPSTTGWPSSGTATPLDGNLSAIALLNGNRKAHDELPIDWRSPYSIARKTKYGFCAKYRAGALKFRRASKQTYDALPRWVQVSIDIVAYILTGVWNAMSPPLWAMVAALIVACIPRLQHTLFTKGTFLNTSITRAVEQSSGVAVPLILVVLGANLGYLPEENRLTSDAKFDKKLLWISMVSRMVIPVVFAGPIIALIAKFVPISIVDDPVFVVVAFLLLGAPSALQLAQICQINDVYVSVMTKLLFQSYVVW